MVEKAVIDETDEVLNGAVSSTSGGPLGVSFRRRVPTLGSHPAYWKLFRGSLPIHRHLPRWGTRATPGKAGEREPPYLDGGPPERSISVPAPRLRAAPGQPPGLTPPTPDRGARFSGSGDARR